MARSLEDIIEEIWRKNDGTRELSMDEKYIINYMRMHEKDTITALVQELVGDFIKKAEELGLFVRNRSEAVHRDLDDGDTVLLGSEFSGDFLGH